MATVKALEALDLDNLDLNSVYSGRNYGSVSNFYDDLNVVFSSTTYKDVLEVYWHYDNGSYPSYFGGSPISNKF